MAGFVGEMGTLSLICSLQLSYCHQYAFVRAVLVYTSFEVEGAEGQAQSNFQFALLLIV